MAKNKPLAEALAKELGYKDLADMQKSVGRGGDFMGGVKGRLSEGESFSEAIKGGFTDVKETAKKSVSPKRLGKKVYGEMFKGDDLISAYMRGRLVKKDKKRTSPTPEGDEKTTSGVSADAAAFIKIIAKSSMSLHLMARDVNVMRQNVQKLVKLKGGKAKGSADAHFLKSSEREKALESQRSKMMGKTSPTQAGAQAAVQTASEGGGFFSIVGSFLMGIVQAIAIDKIIEKFGGKEKIIQGLKKFFNPKVILSALGKAVRFIPIIGQVVAAVLAIGNGIIDAVAEFVKSGDIKETFYAFLGGIWDFITFGLIDKDVIKKYLGPIIDPVFDTISSIFSGIKNFVKKIFGIEDETELPKKSEEPPPQIQPTAPGAKDAGKSAETTTPTPVATKASPAAAKKSAEGDANLESLEMAEGDLQQLFADWKREKGRVEQQLVMKYPDGYVDDPSSPEYPAELKAIDDKYKPLVDSKKKEIQKLKGAPGVKDAMKRRDKEDQDWDSVEEVVTKPSKTAGSKFTKTETTEVSGGGSTTTMLAKTPDAEKAEKQLLELDAKQAEDRKKLVDKLKAEGKVGSGAQALKDLKNDPEYNALKAKQDEERAALVKKIDSGTSVQTTSSGGAAGGASISSAGGGGGGGGESSPTLSSGGGAPSGTAIGSDSASVSEGQRMESAADEGSVINAPTTNNSGTSKTGNEKAKAADVYDADLATMLVTT